MGDNRRNLESDISKLRTMSNFTEPTDKKFTKEILDHAPRQSKAWIDFDQRVGEADTVIPKKYKELMSIAIALTTQCPYCLERHVEKAKKLGASKEELAETIMITAALRSGAAMGYGLLLMKLYDENKSCMR